MGRMIPSTVYFIHIPKTGGTSINVALGRLPMRPKHTRAKDIAPLPAGSFAFVRNPWDRLISIYSHLRGNKPWDQEEWEKFIELSPNVPIAAPQVDYVCDNDGGVLVDFVGRFENISADFATACRRLDCDPPRLPHLNVSHHGNYREYYSVSTRQRVAELYAKDVAKFGYAF